VDRSFRHCHAPCAIDSPTQRPQPTVSKWIQYLVNVFVPWQHVRLGYQQSESKAVAILLDQIVEVLFIRDRFAKSKQLAVLNPDDLTTLTGEE
jgi:hypothetical protein